MNLIKWITSKLRRKPLLVKPAVNNRSFSKLSLETAYLQGYVDVIKKKGVVEFDIFLLYNYNLKYQ